MHVTQVVGAIDDPEFFIPGGEIEDLFVLGKDDERRKAELGPHGNNVFPGILDDARAVTRGSREKVRAAGNG